MPDSLTGFMTVSLAPRTELLRAATVVVLREHKDELQTLLVKRPTKTTFMGGAHVFPGGRIDPRDDLAAGAWAELVTQPGRVAASFDPRVPKNALVAAVREVFEEVGVLLARHKSDGRSLALDAPEVRARFARHRVRTRDEQTSVSSLFEEEGLLLDLQKICPWAHWVTPSAEARRYDTWFFVAECPADQQTSADGQETSDHRWLSPKDALAAHERGEIALPPPTYFTLAELTPFSTMSRAMDAARQREMEIVLPKVANVDGHVTVLFPWDRAYPTAEGETNVIEPPETVAAAITRMVRRGDRWFAEG